MNAETKIKIILDQLRRTDRTEDEYLQSFFAGVQHALELIAEPRRGANAGRHTA